MHIPVSHGRLEAHLRTARTEIPRGAAVLCHPHPQHGGTMHTKAVFRSAQALNDAGLHVVRFNFRGVGSSTGSYDEGEGEQDDVRAALDWLAGEYPDLPLALGGFSFGSMVGLKVGLADERVRALLGLGLPVVKYEMGFLASPPKPLLVVQGEEDEFGPGPRIQEVVDGFGDGAELVRVPGADHYFHDHFDELKDAVRTWFESGAGARALGEQPAFPGQRGASGGPAAPGGPAASGEG